MLVKDLAILLDETGKATITPAQVDGGSYSACGIASYELDRTGFDCSSLGENTVTLTVTGNSGTIGSAMAIVTVSEVNQTPVFDTVSDATTQEDGGPLEVTITGIDHGNCNSNNQQVETVSATTTSELIEKILVSYTAGETTAKLAIYPKENASGEATISIEVKDNGGTENGGIDTAFATFKVSISPVNDAPVLNSSINPQLAEAGTAFNYTLPAGLFTDPDTHDELTYTVSAKTGSLPSWLSINTSTLSFSGTPGSSDLGNFFVKITATDKAGASASTQMEIIVYQAASSSITGTLYQQSEKLNGGAYVSLYRKMDTDPATYELLTRTTNSSLGGFGFYNLTEGNYIVEASIKDTVKYSKLLTTYYDQSLSWDTASVISLENNSTQQINMVMLEKPDYGRGAYSISGIVVKKQGDTEKSGFIVKSDNTDDGAPVAEVTVLLKQNGTVIASTQTDVDGKYSFLNLPMGEYQLEVILPGYNQSEIVSVEIEDGTTEEDPLNFTVWEGTNVITDIETIVTEPFDIRIFPNPTSGKFTVRDNNNSKAYEIRVYTINGSLVLERKNVQTDQLMLDISGNVPGIYLVKVSDSHSEKTGRLVLK